MGQDIGRLQDVEADGRFGTNAVVARKTSSR